jgi:hypothetical protein
MTSAAAAPAGVVTAQQVVDAFVAAGLPATNVRDNTGPSGCLNMGCVQMVSIDAVSVYQFKDVAAATRYAQTFADKSRQNNLIVLRFKYDGKAPINPALIPDYEATLAQLVGG